TQTKPGRCLFAILLFALAKSSLGQVWTPIRASSCAGDGQRHMVAELRSIPQGMNWEEACRKTPKNVLGILFDQPENCSQESSAHGVPIREIGMWTVPDTKCRAIPPNEPVPGGTGTLQSPLPLEGFADIHVHQMGNFGFGGSIIWGDAFGKPQT